MIKDSYFEDETIGTLSIVARFLYIGLWTLSDDVGNVRTHPAYIRAHLFPYDDLTLADVVGMVDELVHADRIRPYMVEGEQYATIPRFLAHQHISRPSKWRNPPPLTEHSRSTHGALIDQKKRKETETETKRNVSDESSPTPLPAEIQSLCAHLADAIVDNGSKRPTIGKGWHDAARLLVDKDRRPIDEAHQLIDWATSHEFWAANILSMPKFRAKYDQLRLQRQNGNAF
jgi:hypothetical protein|tara:strand:- start:292 stop:981 length:690 start_codon:yes stop_codon:yes gene_type:complete